MVDPYQAMKANPLLGIFGIVLWPRSYANVAYLLLSFPLGIAYLVFFLTGTALGIGLLVLWIGLPILLGVIAASWGLATVERGLARSLLGREIDSGGRAASPAPSIWKWLERRLAEPATWKGLAFLAIKFPLGVLSFVATVTCLAVSVSLLLAPLVVWMGGTVDLVFWAPDGPLEALLVSFAGALAMVVSLHLLNGVAFLWGELADVLLSRRRTASPAPA